MKQFFLILALVLMPFRVFADTQNDRNAINNDTVFYDELSCTGSQDGSSSGGGTATASVGAFVDAYGKMAYDNSITTGVPYEFTLGQAINESGSGQSQLATEGFNFFGIKADSSWTGSTIGFPTKEQNANGSYTTVFAQFRKYGSAAESFADHDKFLRENSRYAAAFQYPNDPFKFLQAVKDGGYATSQDYVTNVGNAIRNVIAYISSKNLFPPSSQVQYNITAPGPSAAASGSSGSCSVTGTDVGVYKNPFRDVPNLSRSRIDQGVDYGGDGPVYAIGNGTVVYTNPSGWGKYGSFNSYALSDGPAAGKTVYVAEGCTSKVTVGQRVDTNTVICQMYSNQYGIETGWADGSQNQAMAHSVYTEGAVTAFGVNFSDFLVKLGAPPGTGNASSAVGSLPSDWPAWQ